VTPRIIDVAVNYDQGPLHGGFGYQKQGDFSQYALRGLYEMGPFVFGGYAQREEVTGRKSRDIGRISAMYVMGAQEFHINVGGTKAGGTFGNTGASQYTLGYNYNLSKRTKIYGFYTAIDNKAPGKVGDSRPWPPVSATTSDPRDRTRQPRGALFHGGQAGPFSGWNDPPRLAGLVPAPPGGGRPPAWRRDRAACAAESPAGSGRAR
jgi:hypothetical protein